MLVKSTNMKKLRQSKNWTQQHLAEVCGLSMRTIQRVENDGVASHETVSAYAAIFEVEAAKLLISSDEFDRSNRNQKGNNLSSTLGGLVIYAFLLRA